MRRIEIIVRSRKKKIFSREINRIKINKEEKKKSPRKRKIRHYTSNIFTNSKPFDYANDERLYSVSVSCECDNKRIADNIDDAENQQQKYSCDI